MYSTTIRPATQDDFETCVKQIRNHTLNARNIIMRQVIEYLDGTTGVLQFPDLDAAQIASLVNELKLVSNTKTTLFNQWISKLEAMLPILAQQVSSAFVTNDGVIHYRMTNKAFATLYNQLATKQTSQKFQSFIKELSDIVAGSLPCMDISIQQLQTLSNLYKSNSKWAKIITAYADYQTAQTQTPAVAPSIIEPTPAPNTTPVVVPYDCRAHYIELFERCCFISLEHKATLPHLEFLTITNQIPLLLLRSFQIAQ